MNKIDVFIIFCEVFLKIVKCVIRCLLDSIIYDEVVKVKNCLVVVVEV